MLVQLQAIEERHRVGDRKTYYRLREGWWVQAATTKMAGFDRLTADTKQLAQFLVHQRPQRSRIQVGQFPLHGSSDKDSNEDDSSRRSAGELDAAVAGRQNPPVFDQWYDEPKGV